MSVYCQTDEEDVLARLIEAIVDVDRYVVDIGAGNGISLSNSRLLMDAGWEAKRFDKSHGPFGGLGADVIEAHVTKDNIVDLLESNGVPKNFGVLTIDIDGNDLYVLDAILRGGFSPTIVLFEFNGCKDPASFDVIEYDENMSHVGGDYYGAAWGAFKHVLSLSGYKVVHESHSLNGYAVPVRSLINEMTVSPKRNQYHNHLPGMTWVDARTLFT